MSTFREVVVSPNHEGALRKQSVQYINGLAPKDDEVTLVINGEKQPGWSFYQYHEVEGGKADGGIQIVLRRPHGDSTAEYCLFDTSGNRLRFPKLIIVQNDNDYRDSGWERFRLLWSAL